LGGSEKNVSSRNTNNSEGGKSWEKFLIGGHSEIRSAMAVFPPPNHPPATTTTEWCSSRFVLNFLDPEAELMIGELDWGEGKVRKDQHDPYDLILSGSALAKNGRKQGGAQGRGGKGTKQ